MKNRSVHSMSLMAAGMIAVLLAGVTGCGDGASNGDSTPEPTTRSAQQALFRVDSPDTLTIVVYTSLETRISALSAKVQPGNSVAVRLTLASTGTTGDSPAIAVRLWAPVTVDDGVDFVKYPPRVLVNGVPARVAGPPDRDLPRPAKTAVAGLSDVQ